MMQYDKTKASTSEYAKTNRKKKISKEGTEQIQRLTHCYTQESCLNTKPGAIIHT